LEAYERGQAVLAALPGADDFRVMDSARDRGEIAAANGLAPLALSDDEVDTLLAFLLSLTDEASLEGRLGVPQTVPSGLPVER
jgi:cytochrome c peroxidase